MGILVDKDSVVLVLGITGKEGSRATKEMIDYGTNVSCGVTPGKGGMIVEGRPVFDSVREAVQRDPRITTAVLYVPPLMVYDAALEIMRNGIKQVVIMAENVPIKDSARLVAWAQHHGCRIIGPSSVGVITVGRSKVGSIAGANERKAFSPGRVGIISKSGGLCAETAAILTQAGIGQSTVIGVGGDAIIGSTPAELLELFQNDKETDAVVLIGEIGGTYEEQAAELLKSKRFTKPLIALIAGRFAESIQRELPFGHAGAIIEYDTGRAEDKKRALRDAGATVATYHDEIPALVKLALRR